MEERYNRILDRIREVPPLSQSALRLIDLMNDENHTLADVLSIVENDSLLTANVLKTVNSAAFGLVSEITSISRAVAYLGDKTVVGMAIGACASKIYDCELQGYSTERGQLWKYSLKTAIASRMLAEYSKGKVQRDLAYTAGILHDIGKSILSEFIGEYRDRVIEILNEQEKADFQIAEEEILGINHCKVGYELAKSWGLPTPLCQAILHYHHPERAPEEYRNLVYIVHLGSVLSMMTGSGTRLDSLQYPLATDYEEYIDLTEGQLEGLLVDVEDEFEKVSNSMQI